MGKLVTLNIDGEFPQGFSVRGEICQDVDSINNEPLLAMASKSAHLPPHSEILEQYRNWQSLYTNFYDFYSNRIKITPGLNNISDRDKNRAFAACKNAANLLAQTFNAWLRSSDFQPIEILLRNNLDKSESTRILLATENHCLRRLPWHEWDLLKDFPKAEISIASPNFQRVNTTKNLDKKDKVKILVILGDNAGTDADEKVIIKLIPDAEICWLIEPQRSELDEPLWRKSWDILFFAGHGKTKDNGSIGTIQINAQDVLTISEIKNHLQQAVKSGLKLAIFNSCDGLGLAYQLAEGEDLHLPQIIVMRENLPVAIAPKFLQYFLENYTQGLSLYSSLRESRQRLQILENDFPCVSWLPVLCQNPAEIPPRWLELGGKIQISPYKGLSAFTENDTEIFFGRKVLTNSLLEKVERQNLVAVIGASGSGKSSLVAAGLIPQWLAQATEILPRFVVKIRPGFPHPNPWENLAEELGKISPNLTANNLAFLELVANLEANSGELAKCLTAIVQEKKGCQILLVIDQFEELYTLCSEENRRSFLKGLVEAVRQESWKVVLTLRADFLSQALDEDLGKIFDERDKLITPMNDEELKEAIALPAEKFEVEIADELIKRMIQDYRQNSGHLPMLQFALEELWKRQKYGVISLASYEEIRGLTQVLGDYAEKIYCQLSQEEKEQARYIFTQLVQPISQEKSGEVRRIATRKIATFADIGKENWQLVIKFADERLVVTNQEKDVASVELIHEVLITAWSRLKNWIEQDWEFRRWQEKLRDNLSQWEQEKKDDFLLQGGLLKEAESWLEKAEQKIPEKERGYVEKSRKRRERERQKLIGGLTGGLAIVSLLAVGAVWQWRRAVVGEEKALIGETNANLRAEIATLKPRLDSSLDLEVQMEVLKLAQKLQVTTDKAIQKQATNLLRQIVYSEGRKEVNSLEGHNSYVDAVAFSPDGKLIASGSWDDTIKLWKTDGTLVGTLSGHNSLVLAVAFSQDGKLIASGSRDETIKLWKTDGTLVKTLQGHNSYVDAVAFSPDGKLIASGSRDKTVKLWKTDGTLVETLSGHNDDVDAVAFSSDGELIVSWSRDKTVKLWKTDGTLVETLLKHNHRVKAVAFSPDGKLIASWSDDKTVKLSKTDGTLVQTLSGHNDNINSVTFSPDGKLIASGSDDNTIKLWKTDGTLVETLSGHNRDVEAVAFSSDGELIVSSSQDNTVKLWKTDGTLVETLWEYKDSQDSVAFSSDEELRASWSDNDDKAVKLWKRNDTLVETLLEHKDYVYAVAFSPDGKLIASGGWDDTIKLWKTDGTLVETLSGHKDYVKAVAFSPDGELIASASEDETIKLWKTDGTLVRTLSGHNDNVSAVAFSPDGKLIASGSWDDTIKLWKTDGTLVETLPGSNGDYGVAFSPDGELIASESWGNIKLWKRDGTLVKTLSGHNDNVSTVAFSPDGKLIASGSLDDSIKVWKTDGTLVETLQGHNNDVNAVAFSPDGELIASGGDDNTIKVWKTDGTLVETLSGHNNDVNAVAFSPDGELIVSGSSDGTVKLWNFNRDELIDNACKWMSDYLKNNPNLEEKERNICGEIEPSATVFFLKGEKLAAEGKLEEAISQFEQAVKLDSNFSLNVARIFLRMGRELIIENQRVESEIILFQQVVKRNYNFSLHTATILFRIGRKLIIGNEIVESGISLLKQAQRWEPDIDLNPDTEEIDRDAEQLIIDN